MDWCNTWYHNYGRNRLLILIILCLGLMIVLLHIWLTPEQGHLMSSAPICWEQMEPSPEVSQQFSYNGWKQLGFLLQETM